MAMSVSSETTFFSMKLQSAICPQLRTGRIDTTSALFLELDTIVDLRHHQTSHSDTVASQERTHMTIMKLQSAICPQLRTGRIDTSVYSTRHLSSAEDKNFPFCPQLRTQKTYGKQTVFSKPSTMAYLTMVVLPSWQLLTQY